MKDQETEEHCQAVVRVHLSSVITNPKCYLLSSGQQRPKGGEWVCPELGLCGQRPERVRVFTRMDAAV